MRLQHPKATPEILKASIGVLKDKFKSVPGPDRHLLLEAMEEEVKKNVLDKS